MNDTKKLDDLTNRASILLTVNDASVLQPPTRKREQIVILSK